MTSKTEERGPIENATPGAEPASTAPLVVESVAQASQFMEAEVSNPDGPSKLRIAAGLASRRGQRERNEDAIGIRVPTGYELGTKGVAAVVADGVSVADAGGDAAQICVQGFLNDYFDAPEAWTVATAATTIATSLNRWLHGLGQRGTRDGCGYATTFTALILKGDMAHVVHVGDTRAYRLRQNKLEQLTHDHAFRTKRGGLGLARAMGMDSEVEIELLSSDLAVGDLYLLCSDGVHARVPDREMEQVLQEGFRQDDAALDRACARLVERALAAGSDDNCTAAALIVRSLGTPSPEERFRHLKRLPFPPDLAPGMKLEGFEVERELQATSRSQIYVVKESESGRRLLMKTPSRNFEDDLDCIERFARESWIGRKLNHPNLAKAYRPNRPQRFLYTLLEYVEGQSLSDWIEANPSPEARVVVRFADQILQGLRAMHRMEMLHQDIKPSNIIINPQRGAVIIDYGSTLVAGLEEALSDRSDDLPLGTRGYTAPERILGRRPSRAADLFSVGVVVYEALTGRLPYGPAFERCHGPSDFAKLRYLPSTQFNPHVPIWLDGAIRKVVAISPQGRYESYSEFQFDLERPNPRFLLKEAAPFIDRRPILFWQLLSAVLGSALLALWALQGGR